MKKEDEPKIDKNQDKPSDTDDFQLYMGLQMLKGWEALRGK